MNEAAVIAEAVEAIRSEDRWPALFEAFNAALEDHDIDDLWVHFTNIPKIGINVNPEHHDPPGVYFYPLSFLLHGFYVRQYATSYKYAYVCTVDRDPQNSDGGIYLQYLPIHDAVLIADDNGWGDELRTTLRNVYGDDYDEGEGDDDCGFEFWNKAERLHKQGWSWAKLLNDVPWVEDKDGIIASQEPHQLIVIDPRLIKVVDFVENKSGVVKVLLDTLRTVADTLGGEFSFARFRSQRRKTEVNISIPNGATLNVQFEEDPASAAAGLDLTYRPPGRHSKWKHSYLRYTGFLTGVDLDPDKIHDLIVKWVSEQ